MLHLRCYLLIPENSFYDSKILKDLDNFLLMKLREEEDNDTHKSELELLLSIEELSIEKDYFKNEILSVKERVRDREEEQLNEIDVLKKMNEELEDNMTRGLGILSSIKESLKWVEFECMEEQETSNFESKSEEFLGGLDFVWGIAKRVEEKLREKRELENSVVSLTEENRDVNTLLRISLIEKEAVEKDLNKLKGNNDQKRVALLQFAERGLQRVGFGFMMGGSAALADQVSEDITSSEEEVVSLASTVEKMMKNLRREITQLRKALEESRSDAERLQCLTEKQSQQIAEQTIYIQELECQESLLSQNVEELLLKFKATQEDVERWRKACELEVEAGKHAIKERDRLVSILKRELEKTRACLEMSNNKLKMKEKVADAAIAAQLAAEKCVELGDERAVALHHRIEEQSRQLEEADRGERINKRKFRRICWPWQPLKPPEMQALLHHRD